MGKLLYTGTLAGVSFEPAKSNLKKLVTYLEQFNKKGTLAPVVKLIPDPENKFDKFAIRVSVGQQDKFFEVGYIPKTHNQRLHEHGLDKIEATMEDFSTFDDSIVGIAIIVEGI